MTLSTIAFCAALTGLEVTAAVLARQVGFSPYVAGLLTFAVLFVVYRASLGDASLTTITVGWIVLSQVAALGLDRWYYHVLINRTQLLGVAVMLIGALIYAAATDSDLPTEQAAVDHQTTSVLG